MIERAMTAATGVVVTDRHATVEERGSSIEDLGEDLVVLASVAIERGRASMLRTVNGVTVRVTVEAA
jgi:hypothetical protein